MAEVKMKVDGVDYVIDTDDLTLGELAEASDMGASIPNGAMETLDPRWVQALIVFAMRRAGEVVTVDAVRELRMGQIKFGEATNGGPPPNRAARRAAKTGNRAATHA